MEIEVNDNVRFERITADPAEKGGKKKRNTYVTSLGGKRKFPQQKKKQRLELPSTPRPPLSDMEASNEISKLAYCCVNGGAEGCFAKHFCTQSSTNAGTTNYDCNSAIQSFRNFRELKRLKTTKEEQDKFLLDLFTESIKSERTTKSGSRRFEMDYRLGIGWHVCKQTFATAYGFTIHDLELSSKAVKAVENGDQPSRSRVRRWTDDFIHDLTFAESLEIFQTNLPEEVVGE